MLGIYVFFFFYLFLFFCDISVNFEDKGLENDTARLLSILYTVDLPEINPFSRSSDLA